MFVVIRFLLFIRDIENDIMNSILYCIWRFSVFCMDILVVSLVGFFCIG